MSSEEKMIKTSLLVPRHYLKELDGLVEKKMYAIRAEPKEDV